MQETRDGWPGESPDPSGFPANPVRQGFATVSATGGPLSHGANRCTAPRRWRVRVHPPTFHEVLDCVGEWARAHTTFFRKQPIPFAALSCRTRVNATECSIP